MIEEKISLKAADGEAQVQLFHPQAEEKLPAIILHGCHGNSSDNAGYVPPPG